MSVEIMWALVDHQVRRLSAYLQHPPSTKSKMTYVRPVFYDDGKPPTLREITRSVAINFLGVPNPNMNYRSFYVVEEDGGIVIIATEEEWERWHSDRQ